jgi:hypothetical protein
VKNLPPNPYARAGGLVPQGRRQKAEDRRQKAEGKNADFLLNFLRISRMIPVSQKNATLGNFPTQIVISHAQSKI